MTKLGEIEISRPEYPGRVLHSHSSKAQLNPWQLETNMVGITCTDQVFNTTSFHLMVKYGEMPREEVKEQKKTQKHW